MNPNSPLSVHGTYVFILSKSSGVVLDVQSEVDGGAVITAPMAQGASNTKQLWKFTADGYIEHTKSGLVLEIESPGTSSSSRLIIGKKKPHTPQQQWHFDPAVDAIFSSHRNFAIDLVNHNGVNVVATERWNGAQRWILVPLSGIHTKPYVGFIPPSTTTNYSTATNYANLYTTNSTTTTPTTTVVNSTNYTGTIMPTTTNYTVDYTKSNAPFSYTNSTPTTGYTMTAADYNKPTTNSTGYTMTAADYNKSTTTPTNYTMTAADYAKPTTNSTTPNYTAPGYTQQQQPPYSPTGPYPPSAGAPGYAPQQPGAYPPSAAPGGTYPPSAAPGGTYPPPAAPMTSGYTPQSYAPQQPGTPGYTPNYGVQPSPATPGGPPSYAPTTGYAPQAPGYTAGGYAPQPGAPYGQATGAPTSPGAYAPQQATGAPTSPAPSAPGAPGCPAGPLPLQTAPYSPPYSPQPTHAGAYSPQPITAGSPYFPQSPPPAGAYSQVQYPAGPSFTPQPAATVYTAGSPTVVQSPVVTYANTAPLSQPGVTVVGTSYIVQPAGRFLVSRHSGKVLSVKEGDARAGTHVVLWEKKHHNNAHQLWRLTPEGYIENVQSGLVLEVEGGPQKMGGKIRLWHKTGTPMQQWIYDSEVFTNKGGSLLVLDVDGAGKSNGTALIAWRNKVHNNLNQKFYFA